MVFGRQFEVIGSAGEHLDEIVVHAIIELPLKRPFELRVFGIARMDEEKISVHRNRRIPEFYFDPDLPVVEFRREVQQRMLITLQLAADQREMLRGR